MLDSLPTYVMSLFPLPPKVLKKLDKLRRDFLWHGCKEIKGYNLVKWEITLKSKDKGGMGIRDLRKQNNSLLMKWLWRYNEEGQALWKDVIRSKYGEYNPWCSNVSVDAYGVGVWRTIRNLWQKLEANTYIEVGDSRRTKFWADVWNKQIPLKESFPDLFLLCSNPDANINECWTAQGWDLIFRRFLNDWEVERVAKLLELLEKFPGITNAPDSLRWKHSKDGASTVSRAYKMESPQQHNSKQSMWRKVWRTLAPTKIKCFTWLVARRACLTHEVLRRKGKIIVSWCSLCENVAETNQHLFLHCNFTTQIWAIFLSLTKTNWTMPENTADLLSCWIRRGGSKSQKAWWRIIPHCIWWTVWKERNSRNFEDRSNSIQKVRWDCIACFYFWCKEKGLEVTEQIVELLGPL